mmetsp:Transcript_41172/g.47406  ORF Transcript_41172/g.47406 Transcript_41172/m.47406 type:complete len:93 (+) Transcript_41172:161-439(+)
MQVFVHPKREAFNKFTNRMVSTNLLEVQEFNKLVRTGCKRPRFRSDNNSSSILNDFDSQVILQNLGRNRIKSSRVQNVNDELVDANLDIETP